MLRNKLLKLGIFVCLLNAISLGASATTWTDVHNFVTAQKAAAGQSDARLIKTGKDDLPDSSDPTKYCRYRDETEMSIAISGNQNFLYLMDEKTTILDVLQEWLGNAAKLDPAQYPEKTNVVNELIRIIGNASSPGGQGNDSFSTIVDDRDGSHASLKADFVNFKNTYATALGYLELQTSNIPKILDLLYIDGFLHIARVRGLGNLTFAQFYHTPAVPEKAAGIGNPFVADSTVNLVIAAQKYGLLVAPVKCSGDPLNVRDVAPKGKGKGRNAKTLAPGSPYCCCNNINHAHYRTCTPSTGTKNCNTCAQSCCLAGVTWCTTE